MNFSHKYKFRRNSFFLHNMNFDIGGLHKKCIKNIGGLHKKRALKTARGLYIYGVCMNSRSSVHANALAPVLERTLLAPLRKKRHRSVWFFVVDALVSKRLMLPYSQIKYRAELLALGKLLNFKT